VRGSDDDVPGHADFAYPPGLTAHLDSIADLNRKDWLPLGCWTRSDDPKHWGDKVSCPADPIRKRLKDDREADWSSYKYTGVVVVQNSGKKPVTDVTLSLPAKGEYQVAAPGSSTTGKFDQSIPLGKMKAGDEVKVTWWSLANGYDWRIAEKTRVTYAEGSTDVWYPREIRTWWDHFVMSDWWTLMTSVIGGLCAWSLVEKYGRRRR